MRKEIFSPLKESSPKDVLLVMVHPWYPLLPPLGLAYISTYIRSKGYRVLLFDFNAKLYNNSDPERRKFWDISTISRIPYFQLIEILKDKFYFEIEKLISLLAERPEPIIGFSTNYLNIKVASYIADAVKKQNSNKLVIFGGPGCFWQYDRDNVIPGSVDFFVIGEGERPFFELVDNFYNGKNLESIAGTVSKHEHKQGVPNPIKNLDEIPFPDFKEFDLNDYGCGEARALPLLTSRGCISKCSFCVDHMMCNPFRMRSPEHVVTEIEYHIKEYNIRNFSFNDLLCNGDLRKLEKICDLIIEKGFDIQWGSYAIARGDMSLELLRKMRRAGCTTICYGIESGSNKVLKAMRKIYTAEDAERTLRLTHLAGIKATFNIIIGYPQEGKKEFKETLAFVKRNKDYIDSIINVSTLFINPTASLGREPHKYELYFPKSPYAFKFISLKRLLPGYYKIFGQMTPVEKLKGVDISEFVDPYGNTKSVRIKRLVKTLNFLNKLGLFKEDPIINVYITKNRKVSRTIEGIQKRWTIESGDLRLKCDYKGSAKLEYKGKTITYKAGFHSALLINNRWYDSSHYEWEIKKITKRKLKVTIEMKELGITQVWFFSIYDDRIVWEWELSSEGLVNSKMVKLGVLLPGIYRYWKSRKIGGELPELGDRWRSIEIKEIDRTTLFPADSGFPILKLWLKNINYKKADIRLESAIKEYGFRFIAFAFNEILNDKESKLKGKTYLYLEDKTADFNEEMENLKLYNVESDEVKISPPIFLANKIIEAEIDKGIKVIYKRNEVTSHFGGNVSFLYRNQLYDTTRATGLKVKKVYKNEAEINISWIDFPVDLLWKIYVRENYLLWEWKVSSGEKLELYGFKIGMLMAPEYIFWSLNNSRGCTPPPQPQKWFLIPLQKSQNRKIKLWVFSSKRKYPIIEVQKSALGRFQLEVPDPERISGNFIQNVVPSLQLSPLTVVRGWLRIGFQEKMAFYPKIREEFDN
jgi:radical SAM superfamily enzyme YgiQ (UPF0313 family)